MSNYLEYRSERGDSYTLTFDDQKIVIECYLLGSILGGTGTDCSHAVGEENVLNFLRATEMKDANELMGRASSFNEKEWRALHHKIMDFQTDSFVWEESNWSNSVDFTVSIDETPDFTVSIDGTPQTDSVLKSHVRVIGKESALTFSFQWESWNPSENEWKPIDSANESTYKISKVDEGKFIRVRVEAREENGLTMSSATSPDSGRIFISY